MAGNRVAGSDDQHRVPCGGHRSQAHWDGADRLPAGVERVGEAQVTGCERDYPPGERNLGGTDDPDDVNDADGASQQVDQHPAGMLGRG
ncbi:hypothetical protein [Kibdelosporangium aridum]|uniref:hypothetical protein n=1 Tax=Kibdelosporangium aridum TaxID=2030 RepID=UPI0035EED8CB